MKELFLKVVDFIKYEILNPFYINIKLIHPEAKMPTIAYEGDAGYDLYASEKLVMKKGKRCFIKTGISTEFPKGYVCVIKDRGSGPKTHITCAGVIDSGYRGEWLVQIVPQKDWTILSGDKVAQFLAVRVHTRNPKQVMFLSNSERGDKKLGSSNFK